MKPLGQHALIIEDEPIAALDLEALLSEFGFRSFDMAATEEEALDRARRQRPDLITADYNIIGGTGLAASRKILEELGPIPVVFVTGNAAQVIEMGAPIVEKPFWPIKLLDACEAAVEAELRRLKS